MRILAFSDLHNDLDAARRVVELAGDCDVVVGAGDFCTAHRGLDGVIDVLRAIDKPTVLVPGNSETDEELRAACRGWASAHVLHGSGAKIAGVPFFGIGGGVPVTPFGSWSFDFTEDEAAELLAGCPPQSVLVSHSPPKDAVDLDSRGRSLGSTAVRDVVERTKPRLVICGHIHASAEQTQVLKNTSILNAGPVPQVLSADT